MERYYGRPEATKETLVEGWIRTGDIGRVDEDGYVYLLDRKSDMIVTGGMNVYTTAVEDTLNSHSNVQAVAVSVFLTKRGTRPSMLSSSPAVG